MLLVYNNVIPSGFGKLLLGYQLIIISSLWDLIVLVVMMIIKMLSLRDLRNKRLGI